MEEGFQKAQGRTSWQGSVALPSVHLEKHSNPHLAKGPHQPL